MEIINNDLNSLPQQVEENMKNIKLLARYLKEAYHTSLSLNDTDTTIAISNTNATSDTKDGWLFDLHGKLFKITSGDGTNLLIEFYTDFRGEQGIQGNDGNDGAQGLRGFSFRFLSSGTISGKNDFNLSDITPTDDIQVNDLLIDSYGNIGEVTNIVGTTITITEEANIFKPLYEHNVYTYRSGFNYFGKATIITNSNVAFTWQTLDDFLRDNGYVFKTDSATSTTNPQHKKYVVATGSAGLGTYIVIGLAIAYGNSKMSLITMGNSGDTPSVAAREIDSNWVIIDEIRPL